MTANDAAISDDPHHLERFLRKQERVYADVVSELRSGRKRSHWMWFVFPQFDGLVVSATSGCMDRPRE